MDAGERPLVSGVEARRTIEFITALYKAAFTGATGTRGEITPAIPFTPSCMGGTATAFKPRQGDIDIQIVAWSHSITDIEHSR